MNRASTSAQVNNNATGDGPSSGLNDSNSCGLTNEADAETSHDDRTTIVRGEVRLRPCLRFGDLLMSTFIAFPLSVGFWRGTWELMDHYSEMFGWGPWASIAIGYPTCFLLYLYQEPLKKRVVPGKINFAIFYILSRLLMILHAFGSVNQWRGFWKLIDDATGLGVDSAALFFIIGTTLSLLFRTFENVVAPPLVCCVDEGATIHDESLRFSTLPTLKFEYFWDCVISVVVVPSLTICSWRGVWNTADLFLYPEDPFASGLICLGVGVSLCLILISTQPFVFHFISNLKGIKKIVTSRIVTSFQLIACVLAWRGVWDTYNLFIVFDTPTLSEWTTIIVALVGTLLLGCMSTVVVRGVSVDGKHEADDEWTIAYFSYLVTKIPDRDDPFPEPWIFRCLCTKQGSGGGPKSRTLPTECTVPNDRDTLSDKSSEHQEIE